jgi:hypothetical protein
MKKLIVFISCLMSTVAMAQLPTNGLKLSLPFTGNADDASGNGNNGTVNGATLTTDRFGSANSAYSFDGNDYIQITASTGIRNNEYSYSFWALMSELPPSGEGYCVYETGTNPNVLYGQVMAMNNNYVSTTGWIPSTTNTSPLQTYFTTGVLPAIDTWYHVVVTRSATTFSLYIDGQFIHSEAISGTAAYLTPTDIYIGRRVQSFQYWKGKLDDIAVYDRVLTPSEITAIATVIEEETSVEVGIYPNPASGVVTVSSASLMTDATVKVYNDAGKLVVEQKHVNGNSAKVNVTGQANGTYILEITQDGISRRTKFIKE